MIKHSILYLLFDILSLLLYAAPNRNVDGMDRRGRGLKSVLIGERKNDQVHVRVLWACVRGGGHIQTDEGLSRVGLDA